MSDSPNEIDWDAIRDTAVDCLNSVWSLICFEERSREADYDADQAGKHLAAIDQAIVTFKRASLVLSPGFSLAIDCSGRHSLVFDSLALATVGEGARPDFQVGREYRFGPVSCATAHETAFELLRMALFSKENAMMDIDLHDLPPASLQTSLTKWGECQELSGLLDASDIRQLKSWIDREWAAVTARERSLLQSHDLAQKFTLAGNPETGETQSDDVPGTTSEYVFKKEGDTWTIGFGGDRLVKGIKDAKAVRDIQHVLRAKQVDVQHLPDNRGDSMQTSDTRVATKEDLKVLLTQIHKKQVDLEGEEDTLVKIETKREIEALQKQLNQNFDKNGKPRKLTDGLDKMTDATQSRVRAWKKANNERFPNLIEHLDSHLKISLECSYRPKDKPPWDLGEN